MNVWDLVLEMLYPQASIAVSPVFQLRHQKIWAMMVAMRACSAHHISPVENDKTGSMNSISMFHKESVEKVEPKAAVAIIRSLEPTEAILLLRRASNTRDPWSGHFAFPGGRWEKRDKSIYETCIREVCEETGITLSAASLEYVLVPSYAGRNVKAPVLVQPYLFEFSTRPEVIVEPSEIDSYLWIETDLFRDTRRHIETEPLPGKFRPAFPLGDYYVWGFTYHLLCSVLQVDPGL